MNKIFVVFIIPLCLLAGCEPAAMLAPIPATNTLVSLTNAPIAAMVTPAPTASIAPAASASGKITLASDLEGDFEIWLFTLPRRPRLCPWPTLACRC